MIAVLHGWTGGRRDWRLISRTPSSADVLARLATDDHTGDWQPAMHRLRDGDGDLVVTRCGDGHFGWRLVGGDGEVLAESPPIYRDEQTCRDGFAAAQRAASLAPGESATPDLGEPDLRD